MCNRRGYKPKGSAKPKKRSKRAVMKSPKAKGKKECLPGEFEDDFDEDDTGDGLTVFDKGTEG